MAQPPRICFPPDRSDPPGNQVSQGTQTQSAISGPTLEKLSLDLGAVSAAYSSPVTHSPSTLKVYVAAIASHSYSRWAETT